MRKILAMVAVLAASVAAGGAAATVALPEAAAIVQIAKPIVQDECACGGQIYVVWTLVYFPNGMQNPAWCERHWSNGNVTWTICY